MATKKSTKMPKTFNLHRAIQKEPHYKSNVQRRDKATRKYFNESANKVRVDPNKFKLGSLYLFDYLRPKLEDDLEYYDAQPCTIFFGNREYTFHGFLLSIYRIEHWFSIVIPQSSFHRLGI